MPITEIFDKYQKLGVHLWVDSGQLRFRAPSGILNEYRLAELRFYKKELLKYINDADKSVVPADPSNRYSPFPLTDIQAAYLIGGKDDYALGGVGCHGYVEFTLPALDKERLERAWHSLINRHDMLRAVVFAQGYQQVLEEVTLPPLKIQNLRGMSPEQVQASIQQIRERFSNRRLPAQWPLFELFLTITDENNVLHIFIDMLIADFVSINIILAELEHLYHQPEIPLPQLEVTFRDLLLFQQSQKKQPTVRLRREQDRKYWMERIDQMPGAPRLPVIESKENGKKISFERHRFFLDRVQWNALCQRVKQKKITPSSAVLAAFAEVIALWSDQPEFCINVTILNRPDLHPQISQIIGDFTQVNVLQVSPKTNSLFVERAQALQQQLWMDLEHQSFSGIEVLRELRRRRNENVLIPIVYTSTMGVAGDSGRPNSGGFMRDACLTYGITQTPQVWIDCQVSEQSGELHLNWDIRCGIFEKDMIEKVFSVFEQLLKEMADSEHVWQAQIPLTMPASVTSMTEKALLNGFFNHVQSCPDAPALIGDGQRVSYRQLMKYAAAIQHALVKKGCSKGAIVAVFLEKSIWQAASVLGILLAGGVCLPIGGDLKDDILNNSGIKLVLTDRELGQVKWQSSVDFIRIDNMELIQR